MAKKTGGDTRYRCGNRDFVQRRVHGLHKEVIKLSAEEKIDVVFCDDSSVPTMPEETPEQAATWVAEREQFIERCRSFLQETT